MNKKIIAAALLFFVVASPFLVFAQGFSGLVPNCGPSIVGGVLVNTDHPCGFNELVALIGKGIRDLIVVIAIPLGTLSFLFAGFKMVTARGNVSEFEKAKEIMTTTLIGFVIVIAAWVVVGFILTAFGVRPEVQIPATTIPIK